MVKLLIKEVEHLAELARIELTQAEKKKYAEQISDILDYVKRLDEVNVQRAKTIDRAKVLKSVMREDKIATSDKGQATREEMLKNAPLIKDRYIKVKTILNV